MNNLCQEDKNDTDQTKGFLAGLLIGGLIGAGTMMLLAPRSGEKTRAQIQKKSSKLFDQTTETMEDAVTQVGDKARQIKDDVRKQAKELEQRGQALLDEHK